MTTNQFIKAVLFAGLIAGTLDASAACIQYYINTGNNPARVFRYVASAVLGPGTMTKELYSMAAIGLLFHYLIATIWALLFFLCFRQIRMLAPNKYVAGVLYAIFVWLIMSLVVVPLVFGREIAENAKLVFDSMHIKNSLIGAGILIIAIGLPISLLADRYFKKD